MNGILVKYILTIFPRVGFDEIMSPWNDGCYYSRMDGWLIAAPIAPKSGLSPQLVLWAPGRISTEWTAPRLHGFSERALLYSRVHHTVPPGRSVSAHFRGLGNSTHSRENYSELYMEMSGAGTRFGGIHCFSNSTYPCSFFRVAPRYNQTSLHHRASQRTSPLPATEPSWRGWVICSKFTCI